MTKERTPYNSMPGDYDTDKLTDLHSPETEPSNYARNINHITNRPKSKTSYNSSDRSIKSENSSDSTERIPTLIKYFDINKDAGEIDKKGEI